MVSSVKADADMAGATISGSFVFSGRVFGTQRGYALNLDHVTIGGDLLLNECFVNGEVLLRGVKIGRDLVLRGCLLTEGNHYVINADQTEVGGDIAIRVFCARENRSARIVSWTRFSVHWEAVESQIVCVRGRCPSASGEACFCVETFRSPGRSVS